MLLNLAGSRRSRDVLTFRLARNEACVSCGDSTCQSRERSSTNLAGLLTALYLSRARAAIGPTNPVHFKHILP